MTLQEADEAAAKHLPVENDGITYVRIIEIGYKYPKNGVRFPFVRLEDKNGHSTTDANPERCKIAETTNAQEDEQ